MNTSKFLMTVISLSSFCVINLFASSQWQLIGLADQKVLSVTVDVSKRVIAGTTKGLYIREDISKVWLQIPTPIEYVKKVIEVKKDELVAIFGEGLSNSDGIYSLCKADTITGYTVKRMVGLFDKPQALVLCDNGLFVGSKNMVAKSIRDTDSQQYLPLQTVKTPQFCFGVESPVCSDLYVWNYDQNSLYAGGYDASLMNPGKSNPLRLGKDSMASFLPGMKSLNVTAIGSIVISGMEVLCLGTLDTGVILYSQISSAYPRAIVTPNKEAVNHLIVARAIQTTDLLVIAVKSGVYAYKGVSWLKIGELSSIPNTLFFNGAANMLYAGTENGVYTISFDPVALVNNVSGQVEKSNHFRITATGRSIAVCWESLDRSYGSIEVLTCAGRLVSRVNPALYNRGKNIVLIDTKKADDKAVGRGVYIVHLMLDNARYAQTVVVN